MTTQHSGQDEESDRLERGLAAGFGAREADGESARGLPLPGPGVQLPDPPGEDRLVFRPGADFGTGAAGRYQILGEIAHGGVGVVYQAHDLDLGRDVALKLLHERFLDRQDVLERFVEEAQIGGQLQHPGIVPVYEMGLQHGQRPYFAMKLIRGRTLAALLAQRQDPAEDRRRFLGIFEQVCQTMAYAHARGVVHRDLKPANVMVGSFGEVQVVDWGFAKVLRRGAADGTRPAAGEPAPVSTVRSRPGSGTSSVAGSVLGTPAYMPPEQALGDVARMDERSDVFSLGALLCELLTGRPPYTEEHGELVPQAARAALDPARARLRASGADAELVALALHCLAPAPQDRPATAQAIAAGIGGYLTAAEERAQKARIHAAAAGVRARATALLSAAAVVVVLLAGAGFAWFQHQAHVRRTHAAGLVTEALQEANAHQLRAQAPGAELAPWDQALAAARRAEEHARSEDVTAPLRTQAEEARSAILREQARAHAEAAQRKRDQTMRQVLLRVRIPFDDDVRAPGWASQEAVRLEGEYASAFRTYLEGSDVAAMPVDRAATALGSGSLAVELAAALDHWALARQDLAARTEPPDLAVTAHLRAVAARLDPDLWRQRLRQLVPEAGAQLPALQALAQSADHETLPALSTLLLGQALWRAGARDAAVAAYRSGHERHPADFALCFGLGSLLEQLDPPRIAEAIEQYRTARGLEPGMIEVHHRLGHALGTGGRLDEALAVFQGLVHAAPGNAHWHGDLGTVLLRMGRNQDALAWFQKALDLDSKSAALHDNIGTALTRQGDLQGGIQHYLKSLGLRPKSALAHYNLANALMKQAAVAEAIAHYQTALEHETRDPRIHVNLGIALAGLDRIEEAIGHYRAALQIDRKHTAALVNLGNALLRQGKIEEGMALYREALASDPRCALAHCALGRSFREQGKRVEASSHFRQALAIDPDLVDAHVGVGMELLGQGMTEPAREHFQRAVDLDPRHTQARVGLGSALKAQGKPEQAIAQYQQVLEFDPRCSAAHLGLAEELVPQGRLEDALRHLRAGEQHLSLQGRAVAARWRPQVAARIAELEAQLDRPLLDIVRGRRAAADAAEWASAAMAAWRMQGYAASARTFEQAFAAHPELAAEVGAGHRYRAACAAALAAAGQGKGAAQLDPAERARLRSLALDWLAADLRHWQEELRRAPATASEIAARLGQWQAEPHLQGLRDAAELDRLPGDAAAAWRSLWRDVEALRTAAGVR